MDRPGKRPFRRRRARASGRGVARPMNDVLTPAQRTIAERVLAEEDRRRTHVVVALSGAHAYGFPSPDSDVDLKGIHVLPTSSLVGLRTPPLHVERMEVIEGVEIDYSSNELGAALASI